MNQDKAGGTGLLVFTDLDGTLMEHETYSVAPAQAALTELSRRGVPVIMVSSKTAAEIEAIQRRLGLHGPFACENGAALHPGTQDEQAGQPLQFGKPAREWLPAIHRLRSQQAWEFEGFSDWTAERVAEITGLDREQAILAKQRRYSEPLLWRGSQKALEDFSIAIGEWDLQLMEGGRFLSLQGAYTKADAMVHLKSAHEADTAVTIVALGDSPNDQAMLEAADIAVIIKSAKSGRIQLQAPGRIIRSRLPGPAGWQEAMDEILAAGT